MTSTFADFGKRRKRQTAATDAVVESRANVTCIGEKENDLEVSDLTGAADVLLDVVAVRRSQMRTRQIGVKPLPSASATTESRPWRRTCSLLTVAACLRHHAVNANASEIENVSVEIEGTAETAISIDRLALVVMTTATMIVSAETERKNVKSFIADVLIEVRMTSLIMEMNARQDPDGGAPMMKMTILEEIQGIPRYDDSIQFNHLTPS